MNEVAQRVEVAKHAVRIGGNRALEDFRENVEYDTKEGSDDSHLPVDIVTKTDRQVQKTVVDVINETFPSEAIVGEEPGALNNAPESGIAWIIDPIDGTFPFVLGHHYWTVSIAVVNDGVPIISVNYFPAIKDLYVASGSGVNLNGNQIQVSSVSDPINATVIPAAIPDHDHRDNYASAIKEITLRFGNIFRNGSYQATLSLVANGTVDGAVSHLNAEPWDTIAGVHLVRQAGGTVTDIAGDAWKPTSTGLVASNGAIHDELLEVASTMDGK